MAGWNSMTNDDNYYYVVTAENPLMVEHFVGGNFPYRWTADEVNGIIQPFRVEYRYNGTSYSLGFNPNLWARSGSKTISDSYITVQFTYETREVVVTALKSSGYTDNYVLFTTYDLTDGNQLIIQAYPKSEEEASYSPCSETITVAMITYPVESVDYAGCHNMLAPPAIPPRTKSLYNAFNGCNALTQAPVIPSSVVNMYQCFYGCVNLEGDVYVYAKGFSYHGAFYNTTKPIIIHSMNENVDVCQQLASTANNGNVYVNIRPETPISFTDTQMNYMTNEGLKTLSLQTNANLVQCEIPDLVNGGTITTNVNDALIDLCNRNPISYTPVFEGTVTKSGVTFTNNGDGSFTVNGTAPTSERVSQSILNIGMFPPAQYKMTGGYQQRDSEVSYYTGTYVTWKSAGGWEASGSARESTTSYKLNIVSVNIRFDISAGQTVNNVTFTPVITKVGGA